MKIPAIKKLVEANYSKAQLEKAENDLIEENTLDIEVEGADEGEKLTHILAAIDIQEDMQKNSIEFKVALRNYTGKVRNSIN